MAKKKNIFADTADGRVFVRLEAVMEPLVAMIDGLPITTFGDDNHKLHYLAVDVAIEWCRKEGQHHSKEKYATMIAVMERAKAQQAKANAPA